MSGSGGYTFHKVEQGNTLWGIADKYGVGGPHWRILYDSQSTEFKKAHSIRRGGVVLIYPGEMVLVPSEAGPIASEPAPAPASAPAPARVPQRTRTPPASPQGPYTWPRHPIVDHLTDRIINALYDGDYDDAASDAERLSRIAKQLGPEHHAHAWALLGDVSWSRGPEHRVQAIACLQKALTVTTNPRIRAVVREEIAARLKYHPELRELTKLPKIAGRPGAAGWTIVR